MPWLAALAEYWSTRYDGRRDAPSLDALWYALRQFSETEPRNENVACVVYHACSNSVQKQLLALELSRRVLSRPVDWAVEAFSKSGNS